MATTVLIDGQKVAQAVARDFAGLAADFKKATGLTLHVTSGIRTRAEQKRLYDLYRAGKGPLAAAPGTSQHEEDKATATDLRDSGKDAGVTVVGSPRHKILGTLLAKWHFTPAGDFFKPPEGWHVEWKGSNPYANPPAAKPAPKPTPKPAAPAAVAVLKKGSKGARVGKLQAGLNRVFPSYKNAVKVNKGKLLKVDNDFGAATDAWVREFQKRTGLKVDGQVGPATTAKLAAHGITL